MTNHRIYDTHRNDAQDFAFNGAARRLAFGGAERADSRVPVVVIDGDTAPTLEGESSGYITRSGAPVMHPAAYGRRGWSNLIYRCDSRRVVVGRGWYPPCYAR